MPVEFDEALTMRMLPQVLPVGWRQATDLANKFVTDDGLSVIASAERIEGKCWWHVSCARPARLPSWADLRRVKDLFIGREHQAISVLPSEDQYVNHHPHCLHLWRCLDGDVVPDMRRGGIL